MAKIAAKTAPAATRSSKPAVPASRPGSATLEAISALAYQKWQRRGCPIGDDYRDWYEAEKELTTARTGQRQAI